MGPNTLRCVLSIVYNAAIANREVFENNRTIKIIRNLPHPKTKNEHAHSPGWQAYISMLIVVC